MHQFQALINHRNKTIRTFAPRVPISNLLNHRGLLCKSLVHDFYIHRKIGADIKRWVNINQFQSALRFNLFSHGTILERRKDEFVISPYQLIRPALYLPPRNIKKRKLRRFFCITSWFINVLNRLESKKRYFSGSGLPASKYFMTSLFSLSLSSIKQLYPRQVKKKNGGNVL